MASWRDTGARTRSRVSGVARGCPVVCAVRPKTTRHPRRAINPIPPLIHMAPLAGCFPFAIDRFARTIPRPSRYRADQRALDGDDGIIAASCRVCGARCPRNFSCAWAEDLAMARHLCGARLRGDRGGGGCVHRIRPSPADVGKGCVSWLGATGVSAHRSAVRSAPGFSWVGPRTRDA